MALSVEQVSRATKCKLGNVAISWPLIMAALAAQGLTSDAVLIAAAATVATETGVFLPITEKLAQAEHQPELFSMQAKYFPYVGRGYVQITWRANYDHYGKVIGVNLLGTPALACEPGIASKIFAAFFHEHKIGDLAALGNWQGVRRAVNGGLNGWDTFNGHVTALKAEVANG